MDNSKTTNSPEKYPYENLVFEGGGAKGLAYSGAKHIGEKLLVTVLIRQMGKPRW